MKHTNENEREAVAEKPEARVTASELEALDRRADGRTAGLRTHVRAGLLAVRYAPR